MLISNVYLDIAITAGASLAVIIAYSFTQFSLGNRRYAVDYLVRNLWIPIVAVAVVSLALNMQFIADYLGVKNLNYFSYDYAIHNLNNTLTNVKAFYSGYIKATTATAIGISGADLILTILSSGLKAIFDAYLPIGQVIVRALFGAAYVFSQVILFLSLMLSFTVIMKHVSITLLASGSIALPIPRVRRLGITLFIMGMILTYGLPYAINTSIPPLAQDIQSLQYNTNNQTNYGVLYLESYPYSTIVFQVSSPNEAGLYLTGNYRYNGSSVGYHGTAAYQVGENGRRMLVVPYGYYKPVKLIMGYAEFNLTNATAVYVPRGLGVFFDSEKYADKYHDYLYSEHKLTWHYEYLSGHDPVEETMVSDGDIYYVGYPYNYTSLNVKQYVLNELMNLTIINDYKAFAHDINSVGFNHKLHNGENKLESSYSLDNGNGHKEKNGTAYLLVFGPHPHIFLDVSNSKYVDYSYSVERISIPNKYFQFKKVDRQFLYNIYSYYKNLINYTRAEDTAYAMYKFSNWSQTPDINQTPIEDLEKINENGYGYVYMSKTCPTQQDMYTLYKYLHNTGFTYEDGVDAYLISLNASVKPYMKEVNHTLPIYGSYNIDNESKTIEVSWYEYTRYYSYDNITSIGNGTIRYTYDNQTYTANIDPVIIVHRDTHTIDISWNDIYLKHSYDGLLSSDPLKWYNIIWVREYIKVNVDEKPSGWTLYPYLTYNPRTKTLLDNAFGQFMTKNILSLISASGRTAYMMIYLTLALMVSDGIAAMFGGVSGIGYIGGKLYDKVFKAYVYQGLGFIAGAGKMAQPPYGKAFRTSLMKSDKFKDWWSTLISRHGLLGHEITKNIAMDKFGKSVGELTFFQKWKMGRMMIGDRTEGMNSRVIRWPAKFGLHTALLSTMAGRKAVHWFGASRGLGGYIDVAKDFIGSHHIRKWAMHPQYTEHRSARVWKTLEKMEHFKVDRWLTGKTQEFIEHIKDIKEGMARLVQQKENFFINLLSLDVERRKKLLPGLTTLHIDIMNAWLHKLRFKLDKNRLKQYANDYRYIEKKYVTRIGGKAQITGKVKPEDEEKYGNWLNFERYKDAMKTIHKSRYHIVDLDDLKSAYNMAFNSGIIKKFNLNRGVWRAVNKFIRDETDDLTDKIRANKGRIPNVREAYKFSSIQNLRGMRDARRHEHFNALEKQFNTNNAVWEYIYKHWEKFDKDEDAQGLLIDYFEGTGKTTQDKRQYIELKDKELRINHSLAGEEVRLVDIMRYVRGKEATDLHLIFSHKLEDSLYIRKWGITKNPKGKVNKHKI